MTLPHTCPVGHTPLRSLTRLPARTRHASLQTLHVELRAVGHKGLPDTYAVSSIKAQGPINVGSDWMFVTPHAQSKCYGIISEIHMLSRDTIEYVVHCMLPVTHFFLVVERNRTSNPSDVTRGHRLLQPHLKDLPKASPRIAPWIAPQEHSRGDQVPGAPTHHSVSARCISHSESDTLLTTWRVVQSGASLGIGTFVDIHDIEDPQIPIGPAKVVGIRTIERSWVELVVTIHPHYTRTNVSRIILATPLERATLPTNLAYVHSTAKHLLPDVHGDPDIFPVPETSRTIVRRIRSVFANLHA